MSEEIRRPEDDRRSMHTERISTEAPGPLPLGEILLVRPARAPRDPELEARVRDAGWRLESEELGAHTLAATVAAPPSLVLLDLEPFDPALLAFARALREQLSRLAPAVLAVMRTDDEARLAEALDGGVKDVLDRTISTPLLKVKISRHARRSEGARGTIGAYAIRRVLGRGGMGVVYEVERDGKRYAAKVLPLSGDIEPEALVRFRREMDALRGLKGPGIPRFFEAGRTPDAFFYVMELVAGPTLQDLLESGPLPEPLIRRAATDLANALRALHDAGFVHRDMKPANVIVSSQDGAAVLIDYGLAKLVGDLAVTQSSEVFGTIAFMAPELLLGHEASPLTDAYALGMTLFFAALGGSPFPREVTVGTLAQRISRAEVPRPREVLRGLSSELVAVIDGLTSPRSESRLSLREAHRRLAPEAERADRAGLELALTFVGGERRGQVLRFRGPQRLVLGRAKDVEITVFDPNVSRRHCSLSLEADRVVVKDLGSANGTFVNGARSGLAVLATGDRLRVGDIEATVEIQLESSTVRIDRDALQRPVAPTASSPVDTDVFVPGYELGVLVDERCAWSTFEARSVKTRAPATVRARCSDACVDETTRERFVAEARKAATLVHEALVPILDVGVVGPLLYVVTDRLEGETLAAALPREKMLTVIRGVTILDRIAAALELARVCGLVHGGVSPGTVLLRPDGSAVLLDLALAGVRSSVAFGTSAPDPAYVAPELADPRRVGDHRSDVFALGATVYQALAGRTPREATPAGSTTPPLLDELRREVPAVVAKLIARCLHPDPAERPAPAEIARTTGILLSSAGDRVTAS